MNLGAAIELLIAKAKGSILAVATIVFMPVVKTSNN